MSAEFNTAYRARVVKRREVIMSQSSYWIAESNIRDFKLKLEAETDLEKRRVLQMLLAKEEEKLRHADN